MLDDTTIPPERSWRRAKIETDLIWDIADLIGGRRENRPGGEFPPGHMAEAERLLTMFMRSRGRYPVNPLEVDEAFACGIEHGLRPRIVAK